MDAVDICNDALGMCGHDVEITGLTDSSAEAVKCARFWPRARRAVLSEPGWNFNKETSEAVEDESAAELPGWDYAYFRDAGALVMAQVLDAAGERLDYTVRSGVIYTREQASVIEFTRDEEDPERWPEGVVQAVTADLAYRLGKVLGRDSKVLSGLAQEKREALAGAKRTERTNAGAQVGNKNRYAAARV